MALIYKRLPTDLQKKIDKYVHEMKYYEVIQEINNNILCARYFCKDNDYSQHTDVYDCEDLIFQTTYTYRKYCSALKYTKVSLCGMVLSKSKIKYMTR